MDDLINTLWNYANNKQTNHDFEKLIYKNENLKEILGEELYLLVLSHDFTNKNDTVTLKNIIVNFLNKNHPRNEEFINKLKVEFPDFIIETDNVNLPYIVAGSFSHYLIDSYKANKINIIQEGFQFIERLLNDDSLRIQEIASVGFLETIQNICLHNKINLNDINEFLGDESKREWDRIIKFWNPDCNNPIFE